MAIFGLGLNQSYKTVNLIETPVSYIIVNLNIMSVDMYLLVTTL